MNFQLYINFLEGFLYNSSWFIALHEWGKICTAEITYPPTEHLSPSPITLPFATSIYDTFEADVYHLPHGIQKLAHLPLPVDDVFTFVKFLHCSFTRPRSGGGVIEHKSDVEIQKIIPPIPSISVQFAYIGQMQYAFLGHLFK